MTKFFNKLKNTLFLAHFCSIFLILGVNKLENPAGTTSSGFPAPCQNLEKTNDTIPRKRPDRRKNERTDGRTDRPYSIGKPFRLPPGVQKVASVALGTPCSLLSSFTAAIQEQKTECLIQRNLKYVCFVAI